MPEFDYLKILRGYMQGVVNKEGIAYEDEAEGLTAQEQQELKRICDELFKAE